MNAKCLIARSDAYSIPGGWTLQHPLLPGQTITGRSPDDAVATLLAMLRVNAMAATEDEAWAFANADWGRRVIAAGYHDRWLGDEGQLMPSEEAPEETVRFRRILTPRDTGPSLWGTLHLIPLVWTQAAWLAHIDLMTRLIEPGGYEPGCRLCAAHWKSFRDSNPPDQVTDAAGAADWGWRAHNGANAQAGNKPWAWHQAAEKWGWPGGWITGQA